MENETSKELRNNILEQLHNTMLHVNTAYLAFVLAIIFALVSGNDNINHKIIILSLLFCSLPSLVAHMYIDYWIAIEQKRPGSIIRGFAKLFSIAPSSVGFVLLIGDYSWVAAFIFIILIIFWMVMILQVLKKVSLQIVKSNA